MAEPTPLPSYDALQLIAEGVAAFTGATLATAEIVRDDGQLDVVAAAGDEVRLPDSEGAADLEVLPDRLRAPLRDEHGEVRGALTAYLPEGTPAPDTGALRVFEAYAAHAARAVAATLHRERLADRLHLAETARHVVRQASEERSLQHVLETARPALLEGFGALGMWIQTFDEDGLGRSTVYSADGRTIEFTPEVHQISAKLAHRLWDHQHTAVLSPRRPSRLLTQAESRAVETFIASLDVESVLLVPLGAGHQCLGVLALTRDAEGPDWTSVEAVAALDIGRDLGVAVHSVRSAERERRLLREVHVLEARLADPSSPAPDPEELPLPRGVISPDLTRTRVALRSASDALEQAGRRRDAQSRIIADALATGQVPDPGSLEVYRTLRSEHRDAHLYWQVAFDAWQEVSERLGLTDR
ncbi:hypothetical protein [Nocardioides lianchengensis]|uniref:GAF domain-containing protein n=1 Tax=Nocardioides lianchengensis TaxID=1045774 RepID=A0A1G6PHC0_9ACTN|nr:hypothetical protein [Nocardioides lianchengensis]NYG11835.1 GAF domain-containing protein [Nocardioides lianchengensis]SDC78827.1 GAF domain-containing protein [Nocardioides lianchengensis]